MNGIGWPVVQLVLMGVPILAICTVLFAFLERPFMRPRWWKRTTGP